MKKKNILLQFSLYQHLAFWGLCFIIYVVANWDVHQSTSEVFITRGMKVLLQAAVAYSILGWILPKFQHNQNRWQLIVGLIILLFALNTAVIFWRQYFLIPNYPVSYYWCIERFQGMSLFDLLTSWRWIFFKNPANYFPPIVVLMAIFYYRNQYQESASKEMKISQELTTLRNQLNPHFLFNTLNNIYSLAIQKSETTADAVAKLADIMDTMLYKSQERFVDLNQEISLINNYLALEELRYRDRVEVSFDTEVQANLSIAPMILLTLVENAFKHGVQHESKRAFITINLKSTEGRILFTICNSVPEIKTENNDTSLAIGQSNIKKQLKLLYESDFTLNVSDNKVEYCVQLNVPAHDV